MQQQPALSQDPGEALTPREARLELSARGMRLGGIANAVLALLVILAVVAAAIFSLGDIVSAVRAVTLFRFGGTDDFAVLSVILLLLVNTSLLLVTMVGVLAQEVWSALLAALGVLGNAAAVLLLGFLPGILTIAVIVWAIVVIAKDLGALHTNPVMLKELRERMRGARAFAVLTVYLGLMSTFIVLLYLLYSPFNRGAVTSVTGDLGRTLFVGLIGLEMMLIVFIAPAFTAGAVTGERERKTFDLLQITLLPRPSFIIGKLESSLSYIFLLLLAAIPLQSIAFLFGGVTEAELLLAFGVLLVTAITLGTLGLFFSTVADRTITASVRAYTFAFGILFGVPIFTGPLLGIFNNAIAGIGSGFSGAPVIEAALMYVGAFLTSINPITTLVASQQLVIDRNVLGFWSATLNSSGTQIPMVSPWISFTILYLVISAVLITLAVRRMRSIEF